MTIPIPPAWQPSNPTATLRASEDNSAGLPAQWDQGRTGTCDAHAVARQMIAFRKKAGLPYFMPSRAYLNWWGRYAAGKPQGGSDGIFSDAILYGAALAGVCPEEMYTFTEGHVLNRRFLFWSQPVSGPSRDAFDAAQAHKVTGWASLDAMPKQAPGLPQNDLDMFRRCLAEGNTFAVNVLWYKGFQVIGGMLTAPTKQELALPMDQRGQDFDGGHALCVVGYDGRGLQCHNSIHRDPICTISWEAAAEALFVSGARLVTGMSG